MMVKSYSQCVIIGCAVGCAKGGVCVIRNANLYPGANEIQISAVSAEVDEGVTGTKETQLVSISAGRRSVHLYTKKREGVAGIGNIRSNRSACLLRQ